MVTFSKVEDLPWKMGWGGVVKAELMDLTNRSWTFLLCDDETYVAYAVNNGSEEFLKSDLSKKELEDILSNLTFQPKVKK